MTEKKINNAADPQIVKNLETGRCWQVDYFGDEYVGLRRGNLVVGVGRVGLVDLYEVVC